MKIESERIQSLRKILLANCGIDVNDDEALVLAGDLISLIEAFID